MERFDPIFLFLDPPAASPGNHGVQSNVAAYEPDWVANPVPGSSSQLSAPHTTQAQPQGSFGNLPLANSGLSGFNSLGELHGSGPQQSHGNQVWSNLDNSDNLNQANTNTHDSGYHSLTPIPTVPVGNHQTSISTHGYDFGSLHQHHLQHRMSSGSHATEGSDASIMSRNTRAYRPATRKRRRDHLSSQSGNPESPQRSNKAQRLDRDSAKPQGYEFIPVDSESALADSRWMPHPVTPNSRFSHGPKLDRKQKAFIRRWFEGFYDGQASLDLANKDLTALATLSKAPTQSIRDYLNKKCVNRPEAQRQGDLSVHRQRLGTNCLPEPDATYSFREANQHLTPTTLQQVEKYVKAFGKRRQPGDGRRKVNRGPFRCTFKCGYRTKRPFDWRRHEETHEPQELWLCHFCSQENEQTPFLVNRKDKLLQHAKDNHKGRNPEEAVEKSRVDFRPKPNTRCPLCFENSDNWDERCKHIISHYEDQQMHAKSRHRQNPRARGQRSSDEDSSEPKENDTSDDTSDDEDDDPGSLQDRPPGGDPTGGAGGGSAGPSALYPYKGSDDYHLGNGTSGGAASYDYPSNGYSSHSFGVFSMAATSFEDPVVEASSGTALHSRAYFVQPSYSRVHLGSGKAATSAPIRDAHRTQCLAFLGRGSHGFVDTVQDYVTGGLYARKTSRHQSFTKEIEIVKRLSHPHIIQFIAAYLQNGLPKLIMSPVAQSTLGDWLESPRSDPINLARVHAWVGCLASALKHIHSERIRHADVKPQNVLLRGSDIFITDFGISRVLSEADSNSSSISPSTPLYAPVEIAEHNTHVHGRKADVFSLGCVVLEMLSYAQGKGVIDLRRHLGLLRSGHDSLQDTGAYYKVRNEISRWITMMRDGATETTQILWNICEKMLDNDSGLRPSSAILLADVRQALEGNDVACEACNSSVTEKDMYQADSDPQSPTNLQLVGGNNKSASSDRSSKDLSQITLSGKRFRKFTERTLDSRKRSASAVTCVCPVKETRFPTLLGLFDILIEYENAPFGTVDIFSIANPFTDPPPPAYHDVLLYPVSTSVTEATARGQPHEAGYAAQMDFGTIGTQPVPKDGHEALSPTVLVHGLCHRCSSKTNKCTRCESRSRMNRLPRKANHELAAIGSHLHPPVYSTLDSGSNILAGSSTCDPLTETETDTAVLELVLTSSSRLGNVPRERFIEDCPSTFDRIHTPSRHSIVRHQSSTTSFSSAVDSQFYCRPSDTEPSSTSSLPSTSLASYSPKSSRLTPSHREQSRLSRRRNRQFISGRSRQSIRIRQQAMNDHNTTTLDSRDLTSRLNRIHKANSTGNDGDLVSRLPRMSRSGTTSSDTSVVFSRLPAFRKSTSSSTASNDSVSRLEVMHTIPLSATHKESVEIGQGEFSKPSIRRRRASNESSKSHKEFQYYGRHANSWLFNDFSVTGTVKKGWDRFFSKSDGEE